MTNATIVENLAALLAPVMERQKARNFGVGYKHDASGVPITTGYTHGPGGVLTFPGVDPTVFHTVMSATSIMGQLPTMPSLYTNPTFMTITGVLGDSGSEKEDVCDDAPIGGLMKGCLTTSVFGRYERSTPELELNRLGQRVDRSDPLDLMLVGSPIDGTGIFGAGPESPSAPGDVFLNEVSRKFWERNVSFWRLLSRQLWAGTPTNNSAGGGYKEMTSFSLLVNTGYRDVETGQLCSAMDSYVRDANHVKIEDEGPALVAEVTNMFHQVYRRAEMTGMLPVRWLFAMRSQMFYELTAVWPCAYLSYRCNVGSANAVEFIDAQDAIRFRDEMRSGRYLLVDGIRVDVVLDDGIPELTGNDGVDAGCFESDIYLIPMSVVGGRSVTFMEYFQYSNPSITDALGKMILGTIEGAFLTWPRQLNQCIVWQSKVEPRLIMRTPWLAARLQHVRYCPIQHEREAFPDAPYFSDGGRTSRDGPSMFSLWNTPRE